MKDVRVSTLAFFFKFVRTPTIVRCHNSIKIFNKIQVCIKLVLWKFSPLKNVVWNLAAVTVHETYAICEAGVDNLVTPGFQPVGAASAANRTRERLALLGMPSPVGPEWGA